MKKFTFLGAALLASIGVSAQTFVSTTPANKNVVLEEYTGIYCTWCPDGHKRANDFSAANPGRVVLVNVHTGGYARPQGSDPDFRTTEGDQIAGHTAVDIRGYPAGSVNRTTSSSPQGSGTASSRGTWATDGSTIMSQSSPVNVAVEATYDQSKNEVTAVVEVYYTGTQTVSSNMVSVAILENKISGPQTGAFRNAANVNSDGTYNHNHMLRAMLTPAFGEAISTITSGTFWTKTYTWTVPANLKGVPVKFYNLEVAAWVAEGQQEILTGTVTDVALPSNIVTDLSAVDLSTKPSAMCDHDFTPSIEITNTTTNTVTSFDMSYSINGGAPVTESYTGSLAQGAKTTVNWSKVTLPAGSVNEVTFSGPTNINGGALIDIDGSNNEIPSDQFIAVADKAINTAFKQDFTGIADINSLPANWFSYLEPGSSNDLANRIYVNDEVGGATSAKGVGVWYSLSWATAGDKAALMMGEIEEGSIKNPELKFSYAYAQLQGTENDMIEVMVSTDCGSNWSTAWSKSGADLNPFGQSTTAIQVPENASDWNDATVSLKQFTGDLLVKFVVTSDRGNSLWLDDIEIAEGQGGGGGDVTAPDAPLNLQVSAGNAVVDLDWNDNIEPDLAGYRVFRSLTGQATSYVEVTSSLISTSAFTDNNVTNGTKYYYVVYAEDNAGNVSSASGEVFAIPDASGQGTGGETSVNNFNSIVAGVSTYPNPVNDNLNIDITATQAASMDIAIYDIAGKVVYQSSSNEVLSGLNTISINTASLEAGLYSVEISSTEGSVVSRIVVE